MTPIRIDIDEHFVLIVLIVCAALLIGSSVYINIDSNNRAHENETRYAIERNVLIDKAIAKGKDPIKVGCAFKTIDHSICRDIAHQDLIRELTVKEINDATD